MMHGMKSFMACLTVICWMALSGCGGQDSSETSELLIPQGTQPCKQPELWPHALASSRFPFLVHYHAQDERAAADQVLTDLEAAWQRQINEQGYEPPPSDGGACGPDDRFDVFIWRGINTCQVNIVGEKFVTPWGGRASFMFVDPWGDYGGKYLAQTVAHEFNHATHAANDWYELPIAFEMSATYVEQFYGDQIDTQYISAFQERPDWALLRNDNYETWYMYGSLLYINFLRDYYFKGDDSFLPKLWVAMRNNPDLFVNHPSFVDAVNVFLAPAGNTFMDSVQHFARWRYYAGEHDDGQHFRKFSAPMSSVVFRPEATVAMRKLTLQPGAQTVTPEPMLTGSTYLEVARANPAQSSFELALNLPFAPTARWVVQAVPGLVAGSDGDIVDLSSGSARVTFAANGKRTLILTILPTSGFDPYHQTDARYPVAVRLAP